uniref:CUB domain-containing protein n=1 Tax=Panagrellus redivivus TaxID=6233 RepID=A0A7E4VKD9_PANRE
MRGIVLFILAALIGAANAKFSLAIRLESLTVDGTLLNENPCSAFSALGFKCSPRPKICIELLPLVTKGFADCYSGSYIDLGVSSNTDEIKYDAPGTYSGWQNPSVYSLNSDYQGFQVKLVVYNAEGVYYNLIDEQSFNFTEQSATNATVDGGKISSFTLSYTLSNSPEPSGEPTPPGGNPTSGSVTDGNNSPSTDKTENPSTIEPSKEPTTNTPSTQNPTSKGFWFEEY